MGNVNLIPANRLAKKRRKARLRSWAVICGAYLLLLVMVALSVKVFSAQGGSSVEQERRSTEQTIQEYDSAIVQIQGKLAQAAEELRINKAILNQPDWSKLLALLADELGHDVVLNHCGLVALKSDEREVVGSPIDRRTSPPAGVVLAQRRYGLKLSGFGRTQTSVSQFVLRLERIGIFESVRLMNSYRQAFLNDQAIAFSLECRI